MPDCLTRLKRNLTTFALFATLLLSPSLHAAQQAALLTLVSGEVTLESGGERRAAVPFTRLYEGDRLSTGDAAAIRLVYFDTYQQESWGSGARLLVGIEQSEGEQGEAEERKPLPPPLVEQLERNSSAERVGRVGMVRLRAVDRADPLERALASYQTMRAGESPGEWSATLYLLGALVEHSAHERLGQELERLERERADDPFTAGVVGHYRPMVTGTD
jgi:hypothetical protein